MVQSLRTKRIYEPKAADDGQRILVDRLWPRGAAKPQVGLDLWLKGRGAERAAAQMVRTSARPFG